MNKIPLRAYTEMAVALILVGSAVVASKVITGSFPVFLATGVRFAVSTAILLPLLLKVEHGFPRLEMRDAGMLFLQAFAGNFLFSIFLLYGLKLTSATESGIILGTVPATIGLLSFLFLRERLAWQKIAGMLVATLGIVVINSAGAGTAGQGSNPLLGNILIFGAVIGEALWTIFGKAVGGRVTPLTIAALTSVFGLALSAPFAFYEAWNFHFAAVALLNWLPIVYHGVATVIAYILWYQGIAKVTASTAGIFSGIIPVSAVVLSVLLLREPMFWSYWVGIGCVCGAIVLISGRWHSTQRSSHS